MFISIALFLLKLSTAFAEPCGLYDSQERPLPCSEAAKANWEKVQGDLAKRFNSTGQISGLTDDGAPISSCTANFVVASDAADAPVYVLTAGHCVANPKLSPGKYLDSVKTRFGTRVDIRGISIGIGKLLYAIDDGWDLALYETGYRRSELDDFKIKPLQIERDPKAVKVGDPIEFAGFIGGDDLSLYWSACKLGANPFASEYRFRCSASRGMSGSAVLSSKSGKAIGVLSMSVASYVSASPIYDLASCFDGKNAFDLSIPKCRLPKPKNEDEICASGDGHACDGVGSVYYRKKSNDEILKKAGEYFIKGCELKDAESCGKLAEIFLEFSQEAAAAESHEMACGLGRQWSCASLGLLYEMGVGVKAQDFAKALSLYQSSCGERSGLGCALLGKAYSEGKLIERSDELAKKYFRIGCGFGVELACERQ